MIRLELTLLFLFMTLGIVLISCDEHKKLVRFYKSPQHITLPQFKVALRKADPTEKDHLALWHSMLTGNTRSLSKAYKEKYQALGLSHVFTPSGFHLSALMTPLRFLIPTRLTPYIFLLIAALVFQLPGQDPLKRMALVKVSQSFIGTKSSFYLAMLICVFIGHLSNSPLSFIFSFFFLGIIFSDLKGISLIIWFFIGQFLITFLSGGELSFLNIVFSPLANLGLTIITPFLFLLSFPLGELQLSTGIMMVKTFDGCLDFLYGVTKNFPRVEVHIFTVVLLCFVLWRKFHFFVCGLMLFSGSLNLEKASPHRSARYYFLPSGVVIKTIEKNDERIKYFSDGVCRERLRMGIWEKRCSPKRAPRTKKIKKLSYL